MADCKNAGLKVHEAGVLEGDENGYFLPIMLVDNPPESARIVREERETSFLYFASPYSRKVAEFGPIAPLIKWADEEEVIRLASASSPPFSPLDSLADCTLVDGTHHGLGASVWGTDVARVQRIAGRLDAGMVWMNQTQSVHPLMGFGGHKVRPPFVLFACKYGATNGHAVVVGGRCRGRKTRPTRVDKCNDDGREKQELTLDHARL